ncbi:MAG: transcription termination factor Rho, partial [Atopobiaceae bacterium]
AQSSAEGQQPAPRAGKRRHVKRNDGAQQGQNVQGRNRSGNGQPGNGNGNANANGRRRNRRGNSNGASQAVEPKLSRDELAGMKVAELRAKAAELSLDVTGLKKPELIEAVYAAAAAAEGFRTVEGVLEVVKEGFGFVRTGNYMAGDDDAFISQQMIKSMGLRPGDLVVGTVRPSRPNDKYPAVQKVASVNGLDPQLARGRVRFGDLTPIFPNERLVMEHGKDSITGRAIDLVAPIGKGQRGLIVSPPKAGKTTVLKHICQSIAANNPEVHLMCLLVDERPEEVTDMQRSVDGDVVASTFDMPAENHTAVSELVIERAKRLVEMGEDVVVVLDSITRLARAYNLAQPASGRILSGGVDSAALYPPKRFLGAARNIENGGSLTILASALVDTGSKMDEVIFEEFKGTGNMELKLDRDLADKRIFPAIDPVASGTRNEELLIPAELQPFVWGIRRILANMNNTERAEASLVKSLKATKSNQEFLIRSAKKAQLSEYSDAL